MNSISRRVFLQLSAATALLGSTPSPPKGQVREGEDPFVLREYKNRRRESLIYRLFTPRGYDGQKRYPLMIWLHGSGGDRKILDVHSGIVPVERRTGLWRLLALTQNQAKHQAFVLVPRCPPDKRWDDLSSAQPSNTMRLVLEVLDVLQAGLTVDSQRLCVIGASLGGYGAWDIIAKRPNMFAAAVPICGGGDTSKASLIARTPVWAFHGDQDAAVSVEKSRRMIAAIKKVGGRPRYTEYAGVGHNSWERAYAEPDLLPWISQQRRD